MIGVFTKGMEKVLLYMEENEVCYPSDISHKTNSNLAAVQYCLNKLEKAGVLESEGQVYNKAYIHRYRFNKKYPLLKQLKALLKEANNLGV